MSLADGFIIVLPCGSQEGRIVCTNTMEVPFSVFAHPASPGQLARYMYKKRKWHLSMVTTAREYPMKLMPLCDVCTARIYPDLPPFPL